MSGSARVEVGLEPFAGRRFGDIGGCELVVVRGAQMSLFGPGRLGLAGSCFASAG